MSMTLAPQTTELVFPTGSLVVMAGAPGAGKSYHARRWTQQPQFEVVSSDHYRAVVCNDEAEQSVSRQAFQLVNLILDMRLDYGVSTVVDSTALTPRARRDLLAVAERHGRPCHLVLLLADQAECERNQEQRGYRPIPEFVNRRMHANLEATRQAVLTEGFDSVHMLDREQASRIQRIRWA